MNKLILGILLVITGFLNAEDLIPIIDNATLQDIIIPEHSIEFRQMNNTLQDGHDFRPGAKAQAFIIQTAKFDGTIGEFNYLEDVGENESVVFFNFVGAQSDGYFRNILTDNKINLFSTSPKDVHYVFSTIAVNGSPNEYVENTNELIDSFTKAIDGNTDADYWREHIHIATEPIQNQTGWIGDVYTEALSRRDANNNLVAIPFMIALDKDGILRDGYRAAQSFGYLANVNGQTRFTGENMSFLGLEPWRYTYEREIDEQKLESDYVVPLFERSRSDGGWGAGRFNSTTISLPGRSELNQYDELFIEFHTDCGADGYQYQCPAWDRDISLRLYKDGTFQQEIGRWVTTYWRDGRWMTDITPLLANFNEPGEYEFRYADVDSWVISSSLRFRNTGSELRPTKVVPLWQGGQLNLDYNPAKEEINLEYDNQKYPKAELVAFITGHGNGADAKNCAEFCNNTHHFDVNGTEFVKNHSAAGQQNECLIKVREGVTPLQSGTWYFGRAGWCPGQDVKLWRNDITDVLNLGNNVMNYKCLVDGQDYNPQITNESGYKANIKMTSYVVLWEPKATLSVEQNQRFENLVYPKIANDILYINSDELGNHIKSIKIFDNQGSELINQNLAGETINVSNLTSGLYHIIIETQGLRKISSFIKI
jgi:hypothetical protein